MGLHTPIFIFGYALMQRGSSFRSAARVPTHTLLFLGKRHGVDKMRQALGRAAFNGRSALERNGFKHVKVLTKSSDLKSAQRCNAFVQTFHNNLVRRKMTLQKCLASDVIWSEMDDFLLGEHVVHPVGHKKMGFSDDCKETCFESADVDDDQEAFDDEVLTVMRLCTQEARQAPNSASAGKSSPLDFQLIMERLVSEVGECTECELEESLERLIIDDMVEKRRLGSSRCSKRSSDGEEVVDEDDTYVYMLR